MRFAIILALISGALPAQPAFDAASVKVSESGGKEIQNPATFSPGSVNMRGVTLQNVVAIAYGVKDYQVSGSGIKSEHYDIVAKAADGAGADRLKLMLQGLLAERFKLTFHREQKEMPVYALLVGKKGPKMVEVHEEGPPGVRLQAGEMIFKGATMAKLVEFLSRLRSVDRPVVDMTGIQGFYDMTVSLWDTGAPGDMGEAKRAAEAAFNDPAMPARLAEQLGLKLEPRKEPTEILVVDHAERPAEN